MKNRLKLYCTLLILVLPVYRVTNILIDKKSHHISEEKVLTIGPLPKECSGETIKTVDGDWTRMKRFYPFEVNVKSYRMERDKYLSCDAGEKSFTMVIKKAQIDIPSERANVKTIYYIQVVNIIIQMIFAIFILIIAYLLFVSVYNGKVFVGKVARLMEVAGGLICAMALVNTISSYISFRMLMEQIDSTYLDIYWDYGNNFIWITLGLTLMVFSQIILKGKELQEEQELTI
jgi:ABC-type multidrug transport system fused ATPase/permease subunit